MLSQKDIDDLKLWDHQRKAIEFIIEYLRRSASIAPEDRAGALVNIPTGGGKSAIIATLAHAGITPNKILILTPRVSLRDQIFDDVSGLRGPLRALRDAGKLKSKVQRLESLDDCFSLRDDVSIVITTMQLLHMASKSQAGNIGGFSTKFGCVFIDEGHYEPAQSWSETIRSFQLPSVLFTATPYRNDLRTFKIEPRDIYVTTYADLSTKRILRDLNVVEVTSNETLEASQFVEEVFAAFKRQYGEHPSADRRLIIRCQSMDAIRAVQEAIRKYTSGSTMSIGIHEKFRGVARPYNPAQTEYRQPPSPDVCAHPVWVHQFKLLEGIDGPCFRAVAMHGSLGSTRSLIQQVGRVLRNPTKSRSESALLIDNFGGSVKRQWARYVQYDKSLTPGKIASGMKDVALSFDRDVPPMAYVDGSFRHRYEMNGATDTTLLDSIRVPLRCCLLAADCDDPIGALLTELVIRFGISESPYHIVEQTPDRLAVLFMSVGTSPYLSEHYFVERTLHVYVANRVDGMLAILDTARPNISGTVQDSVGALVSREALSSVLTGTKSIFTEIRSRNMGLGGAAIRARTLRSPSLEASAPMLDDFQFAPSGLTAIDRGTGASRGHSIRSLGFSNSRVMDDEPVQDLESWRRWTATLTGNIKIKRKPPAYLARFAEPLSQPPADPGARLILFDAAELRQNFLFYESGDDPPQSIDIDDTCFELKWDSKNPARREFLHGAGINGHKIHGFVEFDARYKRYRIESSLLDCIRRSDGSRQSYPEHLWSTQEFSIVPDEKGVIYSEGTFFNPKLKLGSRFDAKALGLAGVFERFPALGNITSEKGAEQSAKPSGWADRSVFAWIDKRARSILPGLELLICDDGTKECCDFIAVRKRNGQTVVSLLHVKASRSRRYTGASPLHEVCSQAVKNLGVLNLFNPDEPQQRSSWRGAWKGPSKEGTVDRRVRVESGAWSSKTGKELWPAIKDLLRSPDTQREVILVLGASIDPDKVFEEAKGSNPPAHVIQLLYLLRSTLSSCVTAGAKLRVVCG